MSSRNQLSTRSQARPKSAFYSSHTQEHRLEDNQSLNSIRNHIHRVFSHENKSMKQVKDLTANLSPAQTRRIDRMCVQFSICPNPKHQKRLSEDIDVEFIAKRYVKAKSRDKKKEEQRQELRRSIGTTSKRYDPPQPQEFFRFDHESLRKMQQKAQKASNRHSLREHPYMALYQQSQNEALALLNDRNSFALEELSGHPAMAEPDEWQRETKQIKQIYSGVKNLRSNAIRYRQRKRESEQVDCFYIT